MLFLHLLKYQLKQMTIVKYFSELFGGYMRKKNRLFHDGVKWDVATTEKW